MIKILDEGYVSLIDSWGSDESIIEAARMSTNKGFNGWGTPENPGDEKLLAYLYNNKHSTPFEMAGLTIEVKAPIFVFREWHRHRTQCLSGDTEILCVSPRGTTFHRTIKQIYELKYGREGRPLVHENGLTKAGSKAYRKSIRNKDNDLGYKAIPHAQNRTLKVLNEESGAFEDLPMFDVYKSGVKEIFLLRLEKGHSIKASKDHRFLTDSGWKRLEELSTTDLVAYKTKVSTQERPIPPSLRSGIGVWTSMMRVRLIKEYDYCYQCGQQFHFEDLQLDHKIPVCESLKLALDEENLSPICYTCHRLKINTEQPKDKKGKSREGIKFSKLQSMPISVGFEETYDISINHEKHHNFVANGIIVHNSYNEMSARYIPLPDENYMPSIDRLMEGANTATKNKQAQGNGKTLSKEDAEDWLEQLNTLYDHAQLVYDTGIRIGIPKELARLPVPVARYSRMRASANLRNWLAFLTLRMSPHAQWEIREYANAVGKLIEEKFPRTWELFKKEQNG